MSEPGTPWWKVALWGCGTVVGLGVLGVLALAALMVWSSRATLNKFDELVARTTPGTQLSALLADPFVEDAAEVNIRGPFVAGAEFPKDPASARQALLQRLREHPGAKTGKGNLELMWVHAPPFGRVFFAVDFEDGTVTSAKTSSLD